MDPPPDTSDDDLQIDAVTDESTYEDDDLLADASSHVTASPVSSRFSLASQVDILSDHPASGSTSFSSCATALSNRWSTTSESDAEATPLSRTTSLASSILPPDIEEREESYPWLRTPERGPSSTAESHTKPTQKFQRPRRKSGLLQVLPSELTRKPQASDLPEWQLEFHSEAVDYLSQLVESILYLVHERRNDEAEYYIDYARAVFSEVKKNKIWQWRSSPAVRTHSSSLAGRTWDFRKNPPYMSASTEAPCQLAKSVKDLSWFLYPDIRNSWQRLSTLIHDRIWIYSNFAVSCYGSKNEMFRHVRTAVSQRSDYPKLVDTCKFLAKSLRSGRATGPDRRGIAYGLGLLYHRILVGEFDYDPNSFQAYGLDIVHSALCEILKDKSAPLEVQITVISAISKLTALFPRCKDDYVKEGVMPIIVEHLTSFIEWGRQLKYQSDHTDSLQIEETSFIQSIKLDEIKSNADREATVAKELWNFARGNPLYTENIVGSKLLSACFMKLTITTDEPLECRLFSVNLLMQMFDACNDNDDLRHFFHAVFSEDVKVVCEKLTNADNKDCSNIVPCIIVLTCLANAFQTLNYPNEIYFYEGWEIISTLILIVEKRYPGVITEEVATLLSQHIPVRCLLHEAETQVPALVILCCITKYVTFGDPETVAHIRVMLEWASQERYFIRDAIIKRMILEARSKLDEV